MQKKSVLALLLVLMLTMSGCALVTVDEEKDNARVIIDVNGETVSKREISSAVQNQISQNQYYNQLFASSGYSVNYPTDAATITAQVVEAYTENLVLKQKAAELGMMQMTEEEQAHVDEHAAEYYKTFLDSVISTYFPGSDLDEEAKKAEAEKYVAENDVKTVDGRSTLADFAQTALENEAIEKLEAYIIKDVAVTDEEIQADFDSKVEAAKADYEATPDAYGNAVNNGSTVYYAPAGYRMVKHILVPFAQEDSAAADEKQAALTAAQTALDSAAEDADKAALQAAVDEAQAAYDEAHAAALANAKAKADDLYAQAIAEGADFDALIADNNNDPGMPSTGYAIREGYANFVPEFVTAGMALAQAGDVSAPVESSYGYHILKYLADVQEGPVALETVKDSISSALLSQKQDALTTETIAQWVSEANVKTYLDRLN